MSVSKKQPAGKKNEIDPEVLREAARKIGNSRGRLLLQQPFYGTLVSMVDFIPDAVIKTMATDGKKIYYNPKYVTEIQGDEVFGVLLHEISHCIYLHCADKRRMSRDRHRWNVACDFAVNLEIRDMDYNLPPGLLLDEKYRDMNAEQIYDQLPKDCNCMSTFDDHIPNNSESDWDDMEDKIVGAWEIARNYEAQGKMPAGMQRWIDKLRRARVRWERIFHKYIGQALSKDDYSYTRLNRRLIGQDLYLPDRRNYIIGNVVIAIDTSGSISQNCLEQFAAELAKVGHLVNEVTAITCDAEVHEVVKIRKFESFLKKLKMEGGGGTAFEPVFDKVKDLKVIPELLIYLTDACGSFPKKQPAYPVLWCVTSEDGMNHIPWGQKVLLPNDKGEW